MVAHTQWFSFLASQWFLRTQTSQFHLKDYNFYPPCLLPHIEQSSRSIIRQGRYLSTKERIFSWALICWLSRCRDPNSLFIYADQNEFDGVRQYLLEGKTYTCTILFIQKYFLCNNNFLTFKATLPYNSTLMVLFKVILGSYLHLNMNIVSSHSPLHPSTLFITSLKLS